MLVFLGSAAIVLLAEMADKTQLLAMAFACRFRPAKVLAGVLIATLLNHALAVVIGAYLGVSLDVGLIQTGAGISFVVFGLWSLRGTNDGEDGGSATSRLGPVAAVAIAFFIAEMGDKTQLAALALAAKYRAPALVLAGTTTGMLLANTLAVFAGAAVSRRVPEYVIRWLSALAFIGFGYASLYASLPRSFLGPPAILLAVALTSLGAWLALRSRKSLEVKQ